MEMTTQDIQCYYKDKRQENRKTIFHFMLDGKEYTKQQVSVGTGLSVASIIVLTGDLINDSILTTIIETCGRDVPAEYMPQFEIVDNFDEYYYEGMYQMALEKKEFN